MTPAGELVGALVQVESASVDCFPAVVHMPVKNKKEKGGEKNKKQGRQKLNLSQQHIEYHHCLCVVNKLLSNRKEAGTIQLNS